MVILKTNLQTQQQAHVILFSRDLSLDAKTLIKYYSLRFQIEFNFRDAKQFWGLEDFMNTSANGFVLEEGSEPYICRPPKQLESRIYLTFRRL